MLFTSYGGYHKKVFLWFREHFVDPINKDEVDSMLAYMRDEKLIHYTWEERKEPVWRPRHRWEDNVKVVLKESVCVGVD